MGGDYQLSVAVLRVHKTVAEEIANKSYRMFNIVDPTPRFFSRETKDGRHFAMRRPRLANIVHACPNAPRSSSVSFTYVCSLEIENLKSDSWKYRRKNIDESIVCERPIRSFTASLDSDRRHPNVRPGLSSSRPPCTWVQPQGFDFRFSFPPFCAHSRKMISPYFELCSSSQMFYHAG